MLFSDLIATLNWKMLNRNDPRCNCTIHILDISLTSQLHRCSVMCEPGSYKVGGQKNPASKITAMKHIQILISLVALSFLGATATPAGNADVPPPTDRAISLSREAIPAGATVYGLDGNPLPTETDDEAYDAGPFSGIAKRDDCDGSSLCSKLPAGGGECPAASSAYVDDAWYCGYTSRVSSHCTAIFTCGTYHGTCWAGWFLKQQ